MMDVIADSAAVASIKTSLSTFNDDPARTEFQRGYEACLKDLLVQIFEAEAMSQQTVKENGE